MRFPRIITALLTLTVLLTSCAAPSPTQPVITLPPFPTITNTLIQPTAAELPTTTPTPVSTATVTPLPISEAYHDCDRTPGLTGCDPSAPSIAGRATFFDDTGKLVVIDLASGVGWQISMPEPGNDANITWSPDGSYLLLNQWANLDTPEGRANYFSFTANGKLDRYFFSDHPPIWNADETININDQTSTNVNLVTSAGGAQAWIEGDNTFRDNLTIYVQDNANTPVRTITVPAALGTHPYRLYDWVDGTANLIVLKLGFGVQDYVMSGETIYWVDTNSEKLSVTELNANLYAKGLGALQGTYLAVLDRKQKMLPFGQLALLDGRTGQVIHPLPETTTIRELAWQSGSKDWLAVFAFPEEDRLAVMGLPPESQNKTPDQRIPAKGIYCVNVISGEIQPIVTSGPGWSEGLLTWSTDGQFLLYTQYELNQERQPTTRLIAHRMSDAKEWTLITRLGASEYFGPFLSFADHFSLFIHQ